MRLKYVSPGATLKHAIQTFDARLQDRQVRQGREESEDQRCQYWVYEYLFAKKDRDNIEDDELLAFRLLAKSYAGLKEHQLGQLIANGDFVEICHDDKTEIQE